MDDDEGWRGAVHRELAAGKRRPKRVSPYDTAHWKARRRELKADSVCCLCARFGVYTPAEVADHVVPAADSNDFAGKLQGLCFNCHKIKRRIETAWRRSELASSELDLAVSKEGARLRASAFGVGVDGFQLVRVE